MGTNFYWKETRHEEEGHILQHIGKRSAAGYYCYDCGTTLHRNGIEDVHKGGPKTAWFEACPCCGKTKENRTIHTSTGGVELGFATAADVTRTGVSTCCSFTWTLMKHKREIEWLGSFNPDEKVIVDEYGDELSAREFLEMYQICPIEFQMPCEFF